MPQVKHIEDGPDTIRVLITTDNHVGYNENDTIRGDDSWRTWEEIMNVAKDKEVDMVLQAGDLFHVNKPSKKSMFHVLRAIRLNCLGDKPCELEFFSDPSVVFDNGFEVNYEDPNINVSIPIFSISGNHDDATGDGLLSPMDILSVTGLVNHFGRVLENDKIAVDPLLFQKGSTKLALYGLSNVRDERLFKTFRDQQIKFTRPGVRQDEWFNLMAVHQNHSAHTNTSYLPENFLPKFLDFVVWGHEHECIPYPVPNPEMGFDTLQPGSSVATSLCEGEAIEKCVFILHINNGDYSLESVKLKTIRPFVMRDISLSIFGIPPGPASKLEVSKILTQEIELLIKEAKDQFKDSNPELFEEEDEGTAELIPLPLIRLRVEYSGGYEVENPRRFSNRFVGRVANVNNVVQFYRKKKDTGHLMTGKKSSGYAEPLEDMDEADIRVQDLVNDFLQDADLALLPRDDLNLAVKKFVDTEDRNALKEYIEGQVTKETDILMKIDDLDFDDPSNNIREIYKQFKKESSMLNSVSAIEYNEPFVFDGSRNVKESTQKIPISEPLAAHSDNKVRSTDRSQRQVRAQSYDVESNSEDSDTVDEAIVKFESDDDMIEVAPPKFVRARGGAARGATRERSRGRGRRALSQNQSQQSNLSSFISNLANR